MSGKDVFHIGPGFVGWPVLRLLAAESYTITALCRRQSHADALARDGASRTILSDLHDATTITRESAAHSIILHTATADDLPSVQAVLAGIRQRIAAGKPTIYIHTSGTSLFDDKSAGNVRGNTVYDDADPAMMDALDDDAPHRQVDLAIVRAMREEFGQRAKVAIMVPPEIYGYNAWNGRFTIQIPTVVRFALKHGYAGHVGKGLGVESQIHVNDLARGFVTLLHHMERGGPEATLENPYFYCENGKLLSWEEVAREVGKGLFEAGRIQSPEPREFAKGDYGDLFGEWTEWTLGLNSISRATRLRELGWEPKEKGIWESFHKDELPAMLAENKE